MNFKNSLFGDEMRGEEREEERGEERREEDPTTCGRETQKTKL